jgi:hypothetical protein
MNKELQQALDIISNYNYCIKNGIIMTSLDSVERITKSTYDKYLRALKVVREYKINEILND